MRINVVAFIIHEILITFMVTESVTLDKKTENKLGTQINADGKNQQTRLN